MSLFKRKSTKGIEIQATEKQREKDRKFWTQKLELMRDFYLAKMKKKEAQFTLEKETEIKQVKEECREEVQKIMEECREKIQKNQDETQQQINELKQRLSNAEQKVKDTQKAYLVFKEWIPKALSHANTLRSSLFVKQQEFSQIMGIAHGAEEGLEYLERELMDKQEKLEKDLHIGEKIDE